MNRLSPDTAKLISSLQVITGVENVVKELIENSLDALASHIEIKLENHGLSKVEVRDNGLGIKQADIEVAAQVHYTSKISSNDDLNTLQTYGFRGEALSALCEVSEVSITTRTDTDAFSTKYSLNNKGQVTATRPSHVGQGTTISATNLFSKMPVRCQLYSAPSKQKLIMKNVEDLLISFSLVHPSVRFTLFHNKSLIWQKPKCRDLHSALENVFGSTVVSNMTRVEYEIQDDGISFVGYVPLSSDPTLYRKTHDRCFVYVNSRPIRDKDIEKVLKLCTTLTMEGSNTSMKWPICYFSIQLPYGSVDPNVTSDKTKVMISHKDLLLKAITETLTKMSSQLTKSSEEDKENNRVMESDISSLQPTDHIPVQHEGNSLQSLVEETDSTSDVAEKNPDYIPMPAENQNPGRDVNISSATQWSRGQLFTNDQGALVHPVRILCGNNVHGGRTACNVQADLNQKPDSSDDDVSTSEKDDLVKNKSFYAGKESTISRNPSTLVLRSTVGKSPANGRASRSEKFKRKRNSLNESQNSTLLALWSSKSQKETYLPDLNGQGKDDVNLPEQIVNFKYDAAEMKVNLRLKKDHVLASKPFKTRPVGILKNYGAGVIMEGKSRRLHLVNLIRLKETKLFCRMMMNHSLPVEELHTPIRYPLSSLSEVAKKGISKLDCTSVDMLNPDTDFTDPRICKNGFRVSRFSDSDCGEILQMTALTKVVAYYGWEDFVGILHKIGLSDNLSICDSRPTKVIHFLQSEAVRMSRSQPAGLSVLDDLEETMKLIPGNVQDWECFHNKPILLALHSFQ